VILTYSYLSSWLLGGIAPTAYYRHYLDRAARPCSKYSTCSSNAWKLQLSSYLLGIARSHAYMYYWHRSVVTSDFSALGHSIGVPPHLYFHRHLPRTWSSSRESSIPILLCIHSRWQMLMVYPNPQTPKHAQKHKIIAHIIFIMLSYPMKHSLNPNNQTHPSHHPF
jgi:hypothetical protein